LLNRNFIFYARIKKKWQRKMIVTILVNTQLIESHFTSNWWKTLIGEKLMKYLKKNRRYCLVFKINIRKLRKWSSRQKIYFIKEYKEQQVPLLFKIFYILSKFLYFLNCIIVIFCDFLSNFRKIRLKTLLKPEVLPNCCGFWKTKCNN